MPNNNPPDWNEILGNEAQEVGLVESMPLQTNEAIPTQPTPLMWDAPSPFIMPTVQGVIGGDVSIAQILANAEDQAAPAIFASANKAKKKMETNSTSTFAEIVGYSGLTLHKQKHTAYEKGKERQLPVLIDESLFGIEIEVENCPNSVALDYYWQAKADGSLRNYGVEFVSIPLRPGQVEFALEYLKKQVLAVNSSPDFSNRTSVHVHMNARDFTQDQLYCFVLLYSIFERHFYKFAGGRREQSIFCVPLYKTNYIRKLNDFVYGLNANWSKYCGLNLAPMFSNSHTNVYGTIEFRHLYGTFEASKLVPWINSISALRLAARQWDKNKLLEEIRQMNTVSSYSHMYNEIFKDFVDPTMTKDDFEFCISQVKKELFRDTYTKTFLRSNECAFINAVREGL
jgi:hypothetical protein